MVQGVEDIVKEQSACPCHPSIHAEAFLWATLSPLTCFKAARCSLLHSLQCRHTTEGMQHSSTCLTLSDDCLMQCNRLVHEHFQQVSTPAFPLDFDFVSPWFRFGVSMLAFITWQSLAKLTPLILLATRH